MYSPRLGSVQLLVLVGHPEPVGNPVLVRLPRPVRHPDRWGTPSVAVPGIRHRWTGAGARRSPNPRPQIPDRGVADRGIRRPQYRRPQYRRPRNIGRSGPGQISVISLPLPQQRALCGGPGHARLRRSPRLLRLPAPAHPATAKPPPRNIGSNSPGQCSTIAQPRLRPPRPGLRPPGPGLRPQRARPSAVRRSPPEQDAAASRSPARQRNDGLPLAIGERRGGLPRAVDALPGRHAPDSEPYRLTSRRGGDLAGRAGCPAIDQSHWCTTTVGCPQRCLAHSLGVARAAGAAADCPGPGRDSRAGAGDPVRTGRNRSTGAAPERRTRGRPRSRCAKPPPSGGAHLDDASCSRRPPAALSGTHHTARHRTARHRTARRSPIRRSPVRHHTARHPTARHPRPPPTARRSPVRSVALAGTPRPVSSCPTDAALDRFRNSWSHRNPSCSNGCHRSDRRRIVSGTGALPGIDDADLHRVPRADSAVDDDHGRGRRTRSS